MDNILALVWHSPKFMVLPGTEGMAGYRDYGFHFRGFLIGTLGMALLSLFFAAAVMAVKWVL